jgi:lipoprotein-releasing system ATP-binding protein
MSKAKVIVECHGLERRFSDGEIQVEVLRGVDLVIREGESLAIVGSSGSGKSTLMHLLGGLDTPSGGEVRIFGQQLSQLSEAERGRLRNRSLGFVYQFHHLLAEFTALENVAMPLLIRGCSVAEAEQRAAEILKRVGLEQRVRHKPSELSGGERQRAAIARALVTEPACILADEPSGNLDRKNAQQVCDLLLQLNAELGTALVIVTHDESMASNMGRHLHIEDGRFQK